MQCICIFLKIVWAFGQVTWKQSDPFCSCFYNLPGRFEAAFSPKLIISHCWGHIFGRIPLNTLWIWIFPGRWGEIDTIPSPTWVLSLFPLIFLSGLRVVLFFNSWICARWGFPGGSVVKNPPAMQETPENRVQSLDQEGPWRRKWQPTLVFLPGKSHGQRNWWATDHGFAKSQTRLSDWAWTLEQDGFPASGRFLQVGTAQSSGGSSGGPCRPPGLSLPKRLTQPSVF